MVGKPKDWVCNQLGREGKEVEELRGRQRGKEVEEIRKNEHAVRERELQTKCERKSEKEGQMMWNYVKAGF